jgi:glycosidase
MIDLVLNHTSHLHQWFIEARSSREHPKRNWYIWRDGNAARDARCLFSIHMLEGETVSLEALKITPFEIFVGELRSAA